MLKRGGPFYLLLRLVISLMCAMVIPGVSKPLVLADSKRRVVLCYVRQSFTRNGQDSTSPERQRANIEALLAGSGLILEWYEDVGGHRSGASIEHRPQWMLSLPMIWPDCTEKAGVLARW